MRFKVGDKVRVREDLVVGKSYNDVVFLFAMESLKGKEFIVEQIDSIGRTCGLNDDYGFWWAEEMLEPVEEKEMVSHPSHYNQFKRETIEEMRLLFGDEAVKGFCKCNAYKYQRRAKFKGNEEEDLNKAEWYLDYLEKMGKGE